MKTPVTFLLWLLALSAVAQTYPYSENFTLQVSNQVPSGWQGDVKVLLAHGTNDSKALAAKLSSTTTTAQVSTPLIGPLTSSSALTFFDRIVDQQIYPSTPTNLVTGDLFTVQLTTNGSTYQNVLQIDENNHNPNLNFVKKKIFLSQFAGDTVHLKFNFTYANNAGYFVDVDSVQVKDEAGTGVNDLSAPGEVSMYPNPVLAGSAVILTGSTEQELSFTICDLSGRLVYFGRMQSITTIPAGSLTPGLYLLTAGNTTRKLLITE